MPVCVHEEADGASFRMITAQFCVNGNARQAEIVRAFGVTKISLKRAVERLHHGANAGTDQAIEKLCEELNAAETAFPRANLRLVLKLGSTWIPRDQVVCP